MTVFVLLLLITLFVAYANGANDNFKGVATLYGADVVDYRTAITLATITTFLCSLTRSRCWNSAGSWRRPRAEESQKAERADTGLAGEFTTVQPRRCQGQGRPTR